MISNFLFADGWGHVLSGMSPFYRVIFSCFWDFFQYVEIWTCHWKLNFCTSLWMRTSIVSSVENTGPVHRKKYQARYRNWKLPPYLCPWTANPQKLKIGILWCTSILWCEGTCPEALGLRGDIDSETISNCWRVAINNFRELRLLYFVFRHIWRHK